MGVERTPGWVGWGRGEEGRDTRPQCGEEGKEEGEEKRGERNLPTASSLLMSREVLR